MSHWTSPNRLKLGRALSLAGVTLTVGLLAAACQESAAPPPAPGAASPAGSTAPAAAKGLKIGSLLPSTGDLASVGQQMVAAVPMLVDTVNQCGGVNGEPVTLVSADDQTDPAAGAEAMTRLAEREKVAGGGWLICQQRFDRGTADRGSQQSGANLARKYQSRVHAAGKRRQVSRVLGENGTAGYVPGSGIGETGVRSQTRYSKYARD